MSATLERISHPTIGPIQGIRRCPNVNQFLGIQYATLKNRFARGSLPEYPLSSSGTVDATKFGYGFFLAGIPCYPNSPMRN